MDINQFDIEAWHRACIFEEDPGLEDVEQPEEATEHRPGTKGKVLVLTARYQLGWDLWHLDDFIGDEDAEDDPLSIDWLREAPRGIKDGKYAYKST